ncbi:magnesium transporter CorA [Aeromicrobium sp. PE09-221]|uniref:magnesium and cobalt transport protein CorA n=1 Tax=Aeromicrobium sp. PE09-221 TaxID=1898043 RepID=UPI000B3EA6C3|nr:magnesium and cobalt transport protein CorA [Aeromicrobium sp. PE09-221]OUZ08228.1 magnesium transporter CorA [Aeromicrobium sp. PE09-221]
MIIDCAIYHDGARVRTVERGVGPEGLASAVESLDDDEFLWIGVDDPGPDEIEDISRALNLHPLVVEDILEPHQRPKIDRYHDYLLVSLRGVSYADDEVETHEVDVCVSARFALTVRHGGPSFKHARTDLENDPDRLRHGPVSVLHAVLDRMVDDYDSVAAELETDVEEVEVSVFSEGRTRDSNRIYRLKRESLEFRRAVLPLREPLARLVDAVTPREAGPYFRDVSGHLQRAVDAIEAVDSLLDNALSAHLAQLSIQQNDDMRKLAAGAALFAIPTSIAGIYGMNFHDMPELRWPFGYPLVLGLMALACGYAYVRFKRSGWL